ncbi:MAG: iron ABC transporter permease [Pseudomonadota bacterium]|nr:iron ABC transporter permease [Pseudomonadota bacterium]
MLSLLGLSSLAALLSLSSGAYATSWGQALAYLFHDDGSHSAFAVIALRLPRLLCAFGVGIALSLSGALIQVIVRNPLGDPGLTGVTSGAAFGVALSLTLISASPIGLLTAGVLGGSLAAFLTLTIAGGPRAAQPVHIILAGIAVSVFFLAATSGVLVMSRSSMQTLYIWLVGGFINRGWTEFTLLWPVLLVGVSAALLLSPVLGLLRFDDDTATALGLRPALWRAVAGAVSVLLAAVSVAVAGPLGFVGFVAPHLARMLISRRLAHEHMALWLGVSGLLGGTLVIWADTASRLILAGRAPAGVLIAMIGGLAFLVLARKELSLGK